MDEEKLDPLVRQSIINRLEPWDLVDFLQIPIDDIVDNFENEILDNLDDILDLIGLVREDEEEND